MAFRQPGRQLFLHRCELGLAGQICPFLRIIVVVVEFFASVFVANQSPTFRSYGVVL